ncbi:MAG: type II toxin-antitoxin system RelE/ParE family toxin, partial [Candidatus Binatia bacterium]
MAGTRALFHPGASEDYDAAYAWYLTHGIGIANDFEREVERCLRLIEEGPLRWPRYDAQRRRMIVRKFPYSIIYEIVDREGVKSFVDRSGQAFWGGVREVCSGVREGVKSFVDRSGQAFWGG